MVFKLGINFSKIQKFFSGKSGYNFLFFAAVFFTAVLFLQTRDANAAINTKVNYQGKLTDSGNAAVADGAYDIVFKLYTAAGGGSAIWTESWTDANLFTDDGSDVTGDGCSSGVDKIAYTDGTNESSLAAGQLLWDTDKKNSAVIQSVSVASNYICVYSAPGDWVDGDEFTNRIYVKNGLFSVMLGGVTSLDSVNFNQTVYLGVTVGTDSEMIPRKTIGAVPAAFEARQLEGATWEAPGSIGITTPNSGAFTTLSSVYNGSLTALTVNQSGIGFLMDVQDSGVSKFMLDTNGNVGIGTTAPTKKMEIYGTDNGLKLSYDGTHSQSFSTDSGGNGLWSATGFVQMDGGNAFGDLSGKTNNDLIILGDPSGGSGKGIYLKAYGTDTATWYSGLQYFNTATGAPNLSLVPAGGNVGIGTTAFTEILDINGRLRLAQTTAPVTTTDKLYNVSGNLFWDGINLTAGGALPSGTEGQMLYNNAGAWTAFDGLYWDDTNGLLGIGTTSPASYLDIQGSASNIKMAKFERTNSPFDFVQYRRSAGTWTDITAEAKTSWGTVSGDVLDASGDAFYVGKTDQFSEIYVDVGTAMSTGATIAFEYSTGSDTWSTLTVTDGTNKLAYDGTITFAPPGDWATDSQNSSAQLYFVRMRVSSGSFTTEPTVYMVLPYQQTSIVEAYATADDAYPSLSVTRNGSLFVGYDPVPNSTSSYRLYVNGAMYGASLATGTISGSTGSFSSTVTQTYTAGYTHTAGFQATAGAATAAAPIQNSPIVRLLSYGWDGDSSNANSIAMYMEPNAQSTTSGRMVWKNLYLNGSSTVGTAATADLMTLSQGGILEVLGTNYGNEVFSDGALNGTSWTVSGDWAYTTNDYTYTHSTASGTLTQAATNFATPLKANTWYKFTFVNGVSAGSGIVSYIGTEVAAEKTYFTGSTTEVDVFFKTNSAPGDFVIYTTSTTAATTYRIDDVSLKEVSGGIVSAGLFAGGGNEGLKITGDGDVGIGTTVPVNKLSIADAGTTDLRAGLRIDQSGAIVGTGYGLYAAKTGASTTNIGGYFSATGGTNNYGLIVENGNVGIGTTAPGSLLDIGTAGTTLGTMRLEGNTSGYVQIQPAAAAGSWTMTLPANDGDSGQFLQTNGSGVTTWAAVSYTETDPVVKAINGMVKSNGTTISAATAGTDYSAGTSALATGILKSTTSTGALSIAAGSDLNTTFGSQTANYVYAAPNGTAGNPTFRAIVDADIPDTVTLTNITQITNRDHGSLSGLTDDDHSIYALLAGRAGGQTITGGTAATDDLILKTTSGTGASGADMIFQTGTNGGTEAMRILYDGKVGIRNSAPGALLDIGTAGTTLGTMRLEGNTSGYVQIQPAAAAGSWTMTLPANDGDSGQFLQTNGSGVTTWAAVSYTETDPIVKAINGMVKSNGTTISAATAGTDYSAGTSALATGILKSTTSTGALSIAAGSDLNTTFGSQTANYVYAAPNGTAGNPTFRAIVDADIPDTVTLTNITQVTNRDHGSLSGLTDDDHTIYALLAGRAGGQTITGGTAATDDLVLKTTSGTGASGADMIFQTGTNGGTEAMRILYDGKVGIGTVSPSESLDINGTAKVRANFFRMNTDESATSDWAIGNKIPGGSVDNSLHISNYASGVHAWSDFLTILNSGNVGIGTTAPGVYLDVTGSATNGNSLRLRSGDNVSGNDSSQILMSYNGGELYTHAIKSRHNSGAQSGNAIDFYLWNYGVDATSTTGTKQVMTLDGNGNVGIGTTAASAKLTIGNNVATGFLDNYSEYQQILYDAGTAGLSYGLGIKNSTIIFNSGSGAYSFDRAGAATSMYIDTSGNLGIGTTAPGRQVEIYGTSPLLKFNGHANGEPRTLGSNDYGFVIHNDNDGRYDMVIDNSGNLGIGTTAPAAKLEISDGTYPIRFTPGEFGIISTPAWGSNLEFKTTQSGGTVNNGQLFLEDTGRVGIGTTAPVAHFQVDQFRAGGYSTASNGYLVGYSGYNVGWDGSNWVTRGDSVHNSGFMMAHAAGSGKTYFYNFPSTGGTDQSISDANVNNYIAMALHGDGNLTIGTATGVPYQLGVVTEDRSLLADYSSQTGTDETLDNNYEATKFTASANMEVGSLELRLRKSATGSNFYYGVWAGIFTDNAGKPGTGVCGFYGFQSYGELTTSYSGYQFQCNGSLTSGSTYWIVVRRDTPTGMTVYWDRNGSGTNTWAYSADGSTWTNQSSKSGWFKIYGETDDALFAQGNNNDGVVGYSVNYSGVRGYSDNYTAVYGQSTNWYGGYFYSEYDYGLYGYSEYDTALGARWNWDGGGVMYRDTDGTCYLNPESTSLLSSCSSDLRLKTDIVDAAPVLDDIMSLRIRDYTVIASGNKMTGLIAQETILAHPEMVHMGEDGMYMVDSYNEWKVIKGIQELGIALTDAGLINSTTTIDEVAADDFAQNHLGFVEIIRSVLKKLGVAIKDGVASLAEIVTNKVTTKQICVEGDDGETICLDKDQLKSVVSNSSSSGSSISYAKTTTKKDETSVSETNATTTIEGDVAAANEEMVTDDASENSNVEADQTLITAAADVIIEGIGTNEVVGGDVVSEVDTTKAVTNEADSLIPAEADPTISTDTVPAGGGAISGG